MNKSNVIKTTTVNTPNGPVTVPQITFDGVIGGRRQFSFHVHNSMGQRITGGYSFPCGTDMSRRHGID